MSSLLGQIILTLALISALLQGFIPLFAFVRKNHLLARSARPFALAQFLFVLSAYFMLTIAFASNDFSLKYVVQNSHETLPYIYRITAVWGGHEGSILLWILMLNFWSIAYLLVYKNDDRVLMPTQFLGFIGAGFLAFLIFTSNPFWAISWQEGHDLNPLLQDPGFVIHPPILYAGYVGFVIPLVITLSALWQKKLTSEWARSTRHWATASWSFLTVGITLGSWWAYRVLGWGGFWFWDPVENASLFPWFSGVALIHALIVVEKRGQGYPWAALLAILTFSLSLLGTFLVRSGVLVSAHTFANDPTRGLFLLALLALISGVSFFIYAYKIFSPNPKESFHWLSREMALWLNSILFMIVMSTVLLGTLYPLLFDAFNLGAISVGAPYFNLVLMPLTLIILLIMGLAPFILWENKKPSDLFSTVSLPILLSVGLGGLVAFLVGHLSIRTIVGLSLAVWVILSVVRHFLYEKKGLAMMFAHIGFAVLIIGITLLNASSQDREVRMRTGESVTLGPYQFQLLETSSVQGPNFRGIRGHFLVTRKGHAVTELYPEKRIFTVRDTVMTKVAIDPGVFRDLYVALGEPYTQEEWSVRLYYKPFVRWIWCGGALMMVGGLLSIMRRKRGASS